MPTIPIPPGATFVTVDFVVAPDLIPVTLIPNPTSLAIADLAGHSVGFIAENAAGDPVPLPTLNIGSIPSNFTAHITAPDTITYAVLTRSAGTQTGTVQAFI